MKCSYCVKEASFKCDCLKPFMCELHCGIHIKQSKDHVIENIDINLSRSDLSRLKKNIFNVLQKIECAKFQVTSTTNSLIQAILAKCEENIKILNEVARYYNNLLKQEKFTISDKLFISQIGYFRLTLNSAPFETLKRNSEYYLQNQLILHKCEEFCYNNCETIKQFNSEALALSDTGEVFYGEANSGQIDGSVGGYDMGIYSEGTDLYNQGLIGRFDSDMNFPQGISEFSHNSVCFSPRSENYVEGMGSPSYGGMNSYTEKVSGHANYQNYCVKKVAHPNSPRY